MKNNAKLPADLLPTEKHWKEAFAIYMNRITLVFIVIFANFVFLLILIGIEKTLSSTSVVGLSESHTSSSNVIRILLEYVTILIFVLIPVAVRSLTLSKMLSHAELTNRFLKIIKRNLNTDTNSHDKDPSESVNSARNHLKH